MNGVDERIRRATDASPVVRLAVSHVSRLLRGGFRDSGAAVSTSAGATFLVDLPGEEVLVMPAAEVSVLARSDGVELSDRAIAVAAARLRERQRIERRGRSADWLMVFVDELEGAGPPDDAYRVLAACAANVTDASAAVVYAAGVTAGTLRPVPVPGRSTPLPTLPSSVTRDLGPMRVVSPIVAGIEADSGDQALAPVLAAFGAAQLLCATVGRDAVLIVVERRRDRVFTTDERDTVGWIVRRTERHLVRRSPGMLSLPRSAGKAQPP